MRTLPYQGSSPVDSNSRRNSLWVGGEFQIDDFRFQIGNCQQPVLERTTSDRSLAHEAMEAGKCQGRQPAANRLVLFRRATTTTVAPGRIGADLDKLRLRR